MRAAGAAARTHHAYVRQRSSAVRRGHASRGLALAEDRIPSFADRANQRIAYGAAPHHFEVAAAPAGERRGARQQWIVTVEAVIAVLFFAGVHIPTNRTAAVGLAGPRNVRSGVRNTGKACCAAARIRCEAAARAVLRRNTRPGIRIRHAHAERRIPMVTRDAKSVVDACSVRRGGALAERRVPVTAVDTDDTANPRATCIPPNGGDGKGASVRPGRFRR